MAPVAPTHPIGRIPLQDGSPEHPQNALPALAPRFAVRWTKTFAQMGQESAAATGAAAPGRPPAGFAGPCNEVPAACLL